MRSPLRLLSLSLAAGLALSSPALATPGPSTHLFYLEAEDAGGTCAG